MKKCNWFGHKWIPVFIKGDNVKIIGCYCGRCKKGRQELADFLETIENTEYGTYNEKYFK